MARFRDEFNINLPIAVAMIVCRKAIGSLGWRVSEQSQTRLYCEEHHNWYAKVPKVEVILNTISPDVTNVTLNCSISGWGPFVARYLKKKTRILRNVIELASGYTAPVPTCSSCDSVLPEGALFCMKCGKEVVIASPSAIPAQHRDSAKKSRLWWTAWALLVVALIALRIFFNNDAALAVSILVAIILFLWFITAIITYVIKLILKKGWRGSLTSTLGLLAVTIVTLVISRTYASEKQTSNNITQSQLPTTTITTSAAATPASTTEASTGEQALNKAVNITSVKYDMVFYGQTVTMRWKKNKVRADVTTNGTSIVFFFNADNNTQVFFSPEEKAAEQQVTAREQDAPMSPAKFAKQILKQNPVTLGTEAINGMQSVLIEFTDDDGRNNRAWIEKEHGLLLRSETWTLEGKETVEFKNVEFLDIPDNTFELPPGTQVTILPPLVPDPSPTATPTPVFVPVPIEMPRLYVNSQFHYSIEVLEGWTIDDSDKSNIAIISANHAAFIQIITYDKKTTLESALGNASSRLSKSQGYQELSRTKHILPGSLPAYFIGAKWTNPGDKFLSQELSVITVKTNRDIELIASSSDANWGKYHDQLEKMAYSLAIAD